MADEITRQTTLHGIVEVVETAYPQGEYPPDRSFDDWFHSIEWLEAELAAAKAKSDGRIFQPYTDWGWYVEQMITETGIMYACRANGDIDMACITARELGLLMMEAKMKFQWEADALRGRKQVEGGASTRKATDQGRYDIVQEILVQRDGGLRDAFRYAARRFPYLGGESAFKTSYYKHKNLSKRSD